MHKNTSTNRRLFLFAVILLTAFFCIAPALAIGTEYAEVGTWEEFEQILVSVEADTPYTIVITKDIPDASALESPISGNIILTTPKDTSITVTWAQNNTDLSETNPAAAPLIRVGEGATLTIQNNGTGVLTIQGNPYAKQPLIRILGGGEFILNGGKLLGNTAADRFDGGAVYVDVTKSQGGTFTMLDGEISGNTAQTGGAVLVQRYATFLMKGGTISENTALFEHGGGGGVCLLSFSTFIMDGGSITQNDAPNASGGGIYALTGAELMINGGSITKNTAQICGGVYGEEDAEITIENKRIIQENTDKDGVSNLYIDGEAEPTDVQSPAPLLGILAGLLAVVVMRRK